MRIWNHRSWDTKQHRHGERIDVYVDDGDDDDDEHRHEDRHDVYVVELEHVVQVETETTDGDKGTDRKQWTTATTQNSFPV